ncbi:MAG: hypothetical protein KAJ34_07985, partial [Thermodesulfovibrionia bacterium]|nr:hypothetical protein [Thermodesulfovibrionia bacterium]
LNYLKNLWIPVFHPSWFHPSQCYGERNYGERVTEMTTIACLIPAEAGIHTVLCSSYILRLFLRKNQKNIIF